MGQRKTQKMKSDFYVDRITKKQADELILKYHYLKDISKGYKSGKNFGLFKKNDFSPLNIGPLLGPFRNSNFYRSPCS